jgi:pimeloyl-ACP methyl ester carboxylesterase
MSGFIPWNSQPLDAWADKYAPGKSIDLGGHKTHYIEKGEGEPVILLHGFNFDTFLWVDNIDFLAERFKVYALDLWGSGYSSREPMDYGYRLYADQLLQFMDALGIETATLVGQSMGGGTAILFSTQHRERVNKLILVDPAAMPQSLPLTGRFFNLPRVGEFLLGLKTNVVRKKNLGDIWFHDKGLITDDFFEKATRYQKIKGTTESMMSILRKDFFYTLGDEVRLLAQTDIPILIVFGREDKGVSCKNGEDMHRICKGSRLEIMENAGHVPNYEHSEAFNRIVMDFLTS